MKSLSNREILAKRILVPKSYSQVGQHIRLLVMKGPLPVSTLLAALLKLRGFLAMATQASFAQMPIGKWPSHTMFRDVQWRLLNVKRA